MLEGIIFSLIEHPLIEQSSSLTEMPTEGFVSVKHVRNLLDKKDEEHNRAYERLKQEYDQKVLYILSFLIIFY